MGSPHAQHTGVGPYRRAVVDDVDGLLSATATAAAPVEHDNGDFDGAEKTTGDAGRRRMPRVIIVTLVAEVGGYSTDPWTVAGTVDGVSTTEELTPATADGGETMRTENAFDSPDLVTISIPTQPGTAGSYQIGVSDIVAPGEEVFRQIVANTDGNVVLMGTDGKTELLPMVAQQYLPTEAKRIVGASTTSDLTVWL